MNMQAHNQFQNSTLRLEAMHSRVQSVRTVKLRKQLAVQKFAAQSRCLRRVKAAVGSEALSVSSRGGDEEEKKAGGGENEMIKLACPVTLQPLDQTGLCPQSGLRYSEKDGFWDLTIGAGIPRSGRNRAPSTLQEAARALLPRELRGFLPTSQEFGSSTFELPSVAFAYERGWRQSFASSGFPGPDEEFKMARAVLKDVEEKNGCIVDASCGSGLFTRRFVQTGAYSQVIALDYSESMLQQARTFCEEKGVKSDALEFVRADIARLPFVDSSVDAVHAGAAIHCWPSPKDAVAEIVRVLKPGATFCGTTFMYFQVPFADDDLQAMATVFQRQLVARGSGSNFYTFWDKKLLKDLFESCGLIDFDYEIRNRFIFFSAKKPFPSESPLEFDASIRNVQSSVVASPNENSNETDDSSESPSDANKTVDKDDLDNFLPSFDDGEAQA